MNGLVLLKMSATLLIGYQLLCSCQVVGPPAFVTFLPGLIVFAPRKVVYLF